MPRNAEGFLDTIPEAAAESAPAPEPVVAEAPEAATEPETQTAQPKTEKKDPANSPARPEGYVPRQALEEERRARQEERAARERAETNFQRFLDRWHAENQPQQERPQAPPAWEDDPTAAFHHSQQRLQELEGHLQQIVQGSQQQSAASALIAASDADLLDYAKAKPEFVDAVKFVQAFGVDHLRQNGITDPMQIRQSMDQWQVKIAHQARQMGIRPARLIQAMAEERGWTPIKQEAAAKGDEQRDQPQRDPDTGQFVSAEAKAARIKESQERNGSLASVPGAPVEKMTAKELGKMSQADMWREFDKMSKTRGGKEWERSMGFR